MSVVYSKHPLSIEDQVRKLESRGLGFGDRELAKSYLGTISYYRLRAYTYPFQDNEDALADHAFVRDDVEFEDIIDLYLFDRHLRALVFSELEKVEVAVRTKLSQIYSEATGDSHWFLDEKHFAEGAWNEVMDYVEEDVQRSNEEFIKHYFRKYDEPDMPPSWMSLEAVSFGTLTRLYKALEKCEEKKLVAYAFGLRDVEIMGNWLHAFANLRNACAHHSRIWNRRFIVQMKMPYNTTFGFMPRADAAAVKQNKLFALLCGLKYVVDIISPGNDFKVNLLKLLRTDRHRLLSERDMGFPQGWEQLPVWR